MRRKASIPPDFDPVLGVGTVCELLANVHEDTLSGWVKAGKLAPPIRLSERTLGWRRSVIEKFLAERAAESVGA